MANMGSYTTAPGQGGHPSSASLTDTGEWRTPGTWEPPYQGPNWPLEVSFTVQLYSLKSGGSLEDEDSSFRPRMGT